jgi:hypothetical protein
MYTKGLEISKPFLFALLPPRTGAKVGIAANQSGPFTLQAGRTGWHFGDVAAADAADADDLIQHPIAEKSESNQIENLAFHY